MAEFFSLQAAGPSTALSKYYARSVSRPKLGRLVPASLAGRAAANIDETFEVEIDNMINGATAIDRVRRAVETAAPSVRSSRVG
jgi:hypothetical protein